MDFEFDSSYIIYGFGAILGVVSLVYFGSEIILGLSPTVKAILLILVFALFFISANYNATGFLSKSFYLLSAASYMVFLFYLPGRFDFTTDQTFALLAVSSVLFMLLGYYLKEGKIKINRKYFWIFTAIILALGAVLMPFDAYGAQPTYRLNLEDTVTLSENEESDLGTLTVENEFLFSREVEMPSYSACLHFSKTFDLPVYYRDRPGLIGGGESIQIDFGTSSRRALDELNRTSIEDVSLIKGEKCPEASKEPSIVVYESGRDDLYPGPAPIR